MNKLLIANLFAHLPLTSRSEVRGQGRLEDGTSEAGSVSVCSICVAENPKMHNFKVCSFVFEGRILI